MRTLLEESERIAHFFCALGDQLRLRLLNALSDGERSVTSLNAAVGTSQENISKHLRVLKEAGLVARRKKGRWVFYSIADTEIQELLRRAISRRKPGEAKARTHSSENPAC